MKIDSSPECSAADDKFDSLEAALLEAAGRARELDAQHQEHVRTNRPGFNIFHALRTATYELPHSRFIGYLLNARGNHGCGDQFLRLFLETLRTNPPEDHEGHPCCLPVLEEMALGSFTFEETRLEFPAHGRKIDLVIRFDGHVLAIENKIRSGEGIDQIKDYAAYLSNEFQGALLLYLTLGGESAFSGKGVSYYRISYRQHISPWLQRCVQETGAFPRVHESLRQYHDVVRGLLYDWGLDNSCERDRMKDLADLIRKNPIIFEQSEVLADSVNDVWNQSVRNFYGALGGELGILLPGLILHQDSPKIIEHHHVVVHCMAGSVLPKLGGVKIAISQEEHILELGLYDRSGEWGGLTRKEAFSALAEYLEIGSPQNQWWPAGWQCLINSFYTHSRTSQMLEKQVFDKVVQETAGQILKYINDISAFLRDNPNSVLTAR